MLAYTAYLPPAEGNGEFQLERSLVAFVVRPDRPISRIDLGPIAPIFKAIDEWRAVLLGRKNCALGKRPGAGHCAASIWEPVEPYLDGVSFGADFARRSTWDRSRWPRCPGRNQTAT